jgi:hypothetical protein
MENSEINKRFDYHPSNTEENVRRHTLVRAKFKELALIVNDLVPEGREKAKTLTALEDGLMWANAGIARNLNASNETSDLRN